MDVTVAKGKVSSGRISLTAGQVSTVTFADNIGRVQVWTDSTAVVYVTTDGTTPTVDGREAYEVPVGAIGEYGKSVGMALTMTPPASGGPRS